MAETEREHVTEEWLQRSEDQMRAQVAGTMHEMSNEWVRILWTSEGLSK